MISYRAMCTAAATALFVLVAAPAAHALKPVISGPGRPPEVCFAPNTDRALVSAYARALATAAAEARNN